MFVITFNDYSPMTVLFLPLLIISPIKFLIKNVCIRLLFLYDPYSLILDSKPCYVYQPIHPEHPDCVPIVETSFGLFPPTLYINNLLVPDSLTFFIFLSFLLLFLLHVFIVFVFHILFLTSSLIIHHTIYLFSLSYCLNNSKYSLYCYY
jgi:hypothetical protein